MVARGAGRLSHDSNPRGIPLFGLPFDNNGLARPQRAKIPHLAHSGDGFRGPTATPGGLSEVGAYYGKYRSIW